MAIFGRGGARRRMRALEEAGALRNDGDAVAAVDVLAPLLVEHPNDPSANVEMARALQMLGDNAGAEEHYRRALHVSLSYGIVVELAGVLGAQGKVDEAKETLDGALVMARQNRTLEAGEVHLMRAIIAASQDDRIAAEEALGELEASKPPERLLEYGKRVRGGFTAAG